MATRTFPAKTLNLPSDVKVPEEIYIHGNLKQEPNEIVVLKQSGREVFVDAFVCHIRDGRFGMGIYDMPNFYFLRVGELRTKVVDGIMFTMANIDEGIKPEDRMSTGVGRATWLY